jgi:chemotaxis protein CheZ
MFQRQRAMMAGGQRRFRIEGGGSPADTLMDAGFEIDAVQTAVPAMPTHEAILRRLDDLAAMLSPTQGIVLNLAEAYRREIEEVILLRGEIHSIQEAIVETKRQVAALHSSPTEVGGMTQVAGELSAVVTDTEGATNRILSSAERIEILAGTLQSEQSMEAMRARAGEIAIEVAKVYESCNFQDITGQRIQRVCDTLNFVETRVGRMAEVWGGLSALNTLIEQEREARQTERLSVGTHALAAGPKPAENDDGHVDQSAIDALFD